MLSKTRSTSFLLIILTYIAFIALGLPDGLFGVALPSIRSAFQINLDTLGAFMFSTAAGYFASSFLSGRLISRMGVGGLLAASCTLTGTALIGYTLVPQWWMMVLLGVLAGLGAGAIDAGLNTHVADNFHEGIMQWLHASYGIGVTLGPVIMTLGLNNLYSWRPGYIAVGIFQLLLGVCFTLTARMWRQGKGDKPENSEKKLSEYHTSFSETLRQPGVWLSILLFTIYVGAEISLGTWTYTLLTESRHISTRIAGFLSGSYYVTFTIGRVLAGFYAKRLGVDTIIKTSIGGALIGTALLWADISDALSVAGVAVVGFSIAPIFGALVSGTSRRVSPRFAANTIGIQISSCSIGGSLIPAFIGVLARHVSLEAIPASLFVVFLLFLAVYYLSMRVSDERERRELALGTDAAVTNVSG